MPQVWLVNPIEKGVRTMAKKQRSAAQRAATARLIAWNRAHRKGATKHKRQSARPAAHGGRAPSVTIIRAGNPAHHKGKALGAPKSGKRRHKNPMLGLGSMKAFTRETLMPSLIGGAGALGLDVVLGVLPLPDNFKAGPLRPVTRLGGAIALGLAASMVLKRQTAHQMLAGAITVTLYDTMKSYLSQLAGGKIPGLGVYEIPGIGLYEVAAAPQLGYTDSGQQVGDYPYDDSTVASYVSGEEGVYR